MPIELQAAIVNKPEPCIRSRFELPIEEGRSLEGELIRQTDGSIDINYFADENSHEYEAFEKHFGYDLEPFETHIAGIFERYIAVIERQRELDSPKNKKGKSKRR